MSESSDDDNPIDAIFEGKSASKERQQQKNQNQDEQQQAVVVVENAKPTSHRELPEVPANVNESTTCSVLLFYQYMEPLWSPSEHKRALKKLVHICQANGVTGRGRVAPEGMNCTLTGPPRGIRSVCRGLRDFNPTFWETDFKITDNVPLSKQFKSLSVRKTEELVAYGLKGDAVAPSLQQFAGQHLEADQYHEALQDPDAVVVDVRNFYESRLGSFRPPPNGAKLIDPKLRNSVEFPRWLADPKTQQQFHNKKVLMYCTGGIRCERATALLNQMVSTADANSTADTNNKQQTTEASANNITCKPKGVYELRGGIERYVKTFPEGGFWKGKNYLFDRRMEQVPEGRSLQQVEEEIDFAKCCICQTKWTVYRGQYSCSSKLCGVPVIVCQKCSTSADQNPHQLQCDLCREHYRPPTAQPDLKRFKRKAEELNLFVNNPDDNDDKSKKAKLLQDRECYPDRIFVSRLPLTVTATKLQQALLPSSDNAHPKSHQNNTNNNKSFKVHWVTDPRTKAFYGSCMIQMPNAQLASLAVDKAANHTNNNMKKGIRIDQKRIKVSFLVRRKSEIDNNNNKNGKSNLKGKDEDVFSSSNFETREYPPIAAVQ